VFFYCLAQAARVVPCANAGRMLGPHWMAHAWAGPAVTLYIPAGRQFKSASGLASTRAVLRQATARRKIKIFRPHVTVVHKEGALYPRTRCTVLSNPVHCAVGTKIAGSDFERRAASAPKGEAQDGPSKNAANNSETP
jgi:hypothetical protein